MIPDVVAHVATFSPLPTVCALCLTSHGFHDGASRDAVWSRLFAVRFGCTLDGGCRDMFVREQMPLGNAFAPLPPCGWIKWVLQGRWIRPLPQRRVVFVGLDNSGKTSLLQRFTKSPLACNPPTLYPIQESVFHANRIRFLCTEVGGTAYARRNGKDHIGAAEAFIFVVSSRVTETRDLLEFNALFVSLPKGVPILFMCNKQDCKDAIRARDVARFLRVEERMSGTGRLWYVLPCSAVTKKGLSEGLDWLCCALLI